MASQYDETEQDLDQDDMDVEDDDVLSADADDTDRDQPLEDYNIASREKLREELSSQIEAFLAKGGKINQIPNKPVSDRPSKPASEYTGSLM